MAPINVPSRLQFPTDVHPVHDYMKTVKTSQYSEALIEVRQNGQMRKCSPITSEADMGSFVSCSMAAEHEQIRLRRRILFTQTQTLACRTSKVWPGVTCGLEEEERAVKAKFPREPEEKKSAVENDDVSDIFVSRATSLAFERDPLACRLEFKQEKKCCSEFFEYQLKGEDPDVVHITERIYAFFAYISTRGCDFKFPVNFSKTPQSILIPHNLQERFLKLSLFYSLALIMGCLPD